MPSVADKVVEFFVGSQDEREMKRLAPVVTAINEREPELSALDDDALRAHLDAIKQEIRSATAELPEDAVARRKHVQAVLDDHLVEVFAIVREASKRTLGMRHFDVQLIGGMVLHDGKIAEMKTGEGKTLVATLPVELNALTGRGVHVVTVNDYLARRDAEWMGQIYRFLGLDRRVHPEPDGRRRAPGCLRVRHHLRHQQRVRLRLPARQHEVRGRATWSSASTSSPSSTRSTRSSIDEARTPLIISGPSEESVDLYYDVDHIIPKLTKGEEITDKHGNKETTGDYIVDEKSHTATLTEEGVAKAEKLLSTPEPVRPRQHARRSTRSTRRCARTPSTSATVDYILKDGQVIIVDEFTGRLMPGRRWSDGLHQAVEAKESVKIEARTRRSPRSPSRTTSACTTSWRGMTGTADTEADEFAKIYDLDVVVIPTNRPHGAHGQPGPHLPHREGEVRTR